MNSQQLQHKEKIGRCSELHPRPETYSSSCKQGNHKQCSGFRRIENGMAKCTCAKCNHDEVII